MAPPSNFAVNLVSGGYLATWTNDLSLNANNVISMSLVYTTTDANAQFQSIILEPTVVGNSVINSHLLTNLPIGYRYQMSLQIASSVDRLSGTSNVAEFSVISKPSKPDFRVTAGDQLLFISLLDANNVPITLNSVGTIFDGYESLTKIEISLANKTDKTAQNVTIPIDGSLNFYRDGGFTINRNRFPDIQNDDTYAVALTYFNEVGKSLISDTRFFTPSQLPINMDTAAVESINVSNTATGGATIFWNTPFNALTGIQSVSKVASYSVWRAEVTNGVAGPANLILTDAPVDASGNYTDNSKAIQARDDNNNLIDSVFDNNTYKYVWADTTAVNGLTYRYFLTAKNQFGSSTVKDQSSYLDVVVGGRPSAPGVTSIPSNKQLILSVNTSGKNNGLELTGKVYVKLYAASQMNLTDASQNALHGYDWSEMTLDQNSRVTLTGLNNGTLYGASVKIETQSAVLLGSKYLSAAGSLANGSSPYKAPAVPTGLAISPLDASENPLNGKLKLSWNAQTYLAANDFGPDASVDFNIHRHELDASGVQINGYLLMSSINSLEDTGLVNDKTYYYSLEAVVRNPNLNIDVNSNRSSVVSASPFASPVPVTNVNLDCSGDRNLIATWNNIADAAATYKVVLSKNNVVLDTIYPATSGIILSDNSYNFVLGETYKVEVSSVISRNGGNLYPSTALSATGIPFLTPGAVQNLELAVSDAKIFASWDKPLNMDASGVVTGVKIIGYKVILIDSLDNSNLDDISVSALYQLLAGLDNNKSYKVKIIPIGNAGRTGAGKAVSGETLISSDVLVKAGPVSPVLLATEVSNGSVTLAWTHQDPAITIFKVYKDNQLITTTINDEGLFNSDRKWSTTITGLTNLQKYHFAVIAIENGIASPAGGNGTNATPFTAPTAPNANSHPFSVDDNQITLNWAAPTTSNAGSNPLLYKVEIFDTNNNTLSDADATLVSGFPQNDINGLTLTDSAHVVNGKSYYAKVSAYYTINGSMATSAPLRIPASGSINVNPAPEDVANLTLTPKDKSVVLTWSDPSNANYTYTTTIVERSDNVNGPFKEISSVITAGTFTDSFLINGKTYYYKVTAKHNNLGAQQADGATGSATPAGTPIFTYENVRASNTNKSFSLELNQNGSAVNSYTLIGIDKNGVANVLTDSTLNNLTSLPNVTTFNDDSCLPGQVYLWQLPGFMVNSQLVEITDLLIILTNSVGSKVISWPKPPNAFDK